jgi:alanine dehydrogenase
MAKDLALSLGEGGDFPQGAHPQLAVFWGRRLLSLITMADAIEIVGQAMVDLSAGKVIAPERWAMPLAPGAAMALMPGAYPPAGVFGIKVLSLFEPGARRGLPGHQGAMLLFDLNCGRPLAIFEASTLTGLRTAAASALATRLLSRPDAQTLALIGHGEQARWHLEAMRLVRPIKEIRVWGRDVSRASAFVEEHARDVPGVRVTASVAEAVRGADIICTLTHSAEPVLTGDLLEPGQHLNLVGASIAAYREIDDLAVARCLYVADERRHALTQGGELIHAMAAGVVDANHIHAEIGEILAGNASGRTDEKTITAYKSLGHSVQDLAVASEVLSRQRAALGDAGQSRERSE